MNQVILNNGTSFLPLIRGTWQLSQGHRPNLKDPQPLEAILDAIDCGFYTFDCADIYLGAEELLGKARKLRTSQPLRFHTKYVPDLDKLSSLKFEDTEAIINRSLKRLHVESLDLVQFHWWDYNQPSYLDVLHHLQTFRSQGKIQAIGVTNFDTEHLKEILEAGIDIASIQLQASLLDRRSQGKMKDLCEKYQVKRFGYGSILGGFLSEKWLDQEEPSLDQLENRSLVKYKLLIEEWGDWNRFQSYLQLLQTLASKYDTTLSRVAIQALLQLKHVDAVILGLSPVHYRPQNREFQKTFELSPGDLEELLKWDSPLQGDVYQLERSGKHARIMKYNQNQAQ